MFGTISLNSQNISVVNGTITPQNFSINTGSSIQFKYAPNLNYSLDSIIVNGQLNNDSTFSYTFNNFTNLSSLKIVYKLTNTTSLQVQKVYSRNGFLDSIAQILVYKDSSSPYAGGGITSFIDSNLWDTLFPFRADWNTAYTTWDWLSPNKDRTKDFYSFNNLLQAVKNLSNLRVLYEVRCGTSLYRVTRKDVSTGSTKVVFTDMDFNQPWNNQRIDSQWVNYNDFLNEGSTETKARELCAFLANCSHETTGGWATAPRGPYSWGLYFKYEVGHDTTPGVEVGGYTDFTNVYYPPSNQSYFGRGPVQLSWNYNYGYMSSIVFGDVAITDSATNFLVHYPNWVLWNGSNAWMTAIWFWMTPQYPKPSCHDVMIPFKILDTSNGYGMGATINIINGGIECGGNTQLSQVTDRLGFYQRYCDYFKVSYQLYGGNDISRCNCNNLRQYEASPSSCMPTSYMELSKPEFIDLNLVRLVKPKLFKNGRYYYLPINNTYAINTFQSSVFQIVK